MTLFSRIRTRSFVTLIACLATSPLFAGVVFELEATDHRKKSPKVEQIQAQVEGRNLKMGVPASAGNDGEMIFRGQEREMVIIEHDDKSYMEMDAETIKQMSSQVNSAMKQMQEAMANMPPEQRAMMEKMMKDKMPQQAPPRPKAELRKTGETADKSGYPCVKYEILTEGKKTRELWVTGWSDVEGGDEVQGAFLDMAAFFQELIESMPMLAGQDALADNIFGFINEMNGFPVVTREFGDDGSLERETVLKSAAKATIEPSAFQPPKGYKHKDVMRRR